MLRYESQSMGVTPRAEHKGSEPPRTLGRLGWVGLGGDEGVTSSLMAETETTETLMKLTFGILPAV